MFSLLMLPLCVPAFIFHGIFSHCLCELISSLFVQVLLFFFYLTIHCTCKDFFWVTEISVPSWFQFQFSSMFLCFYWIQFSILYWVFHFILPYIFFSCMSLRYLFAILLKFIKSMCSLNSLNFLMKIIIVHGSWKFLVFFLM